MGVTERRFIASGTALPWPHVTPVALSWERSLVWLPESHVSVVFLAGFLGVLLDISDA
jgi:hypothetical protein